MIWLLNRPTESRWKTFDRLKFANLYSSWPNRLTETQPFNRIVKFGYTNSADRMANLVTARSYTKYLTILLYLTLNKHPISHGSAEFIWLRIEFLFFLDVHISQEGVQKGLILKFWNFKSYIGLRFSQRKGAEAQI